MKAKAKLFRSRPGEPLAEAPPGMDEPDAAPPPDAPPRPDTANAVDLTSHQLRLAQRIARKEGLTPKSDQDAIRQLRKKGIDPFSRRNLIALVQPAEDAQAPKQPSPSPAPAPKHTALPPLAALPESGERSIEDIRNELHRRRQWRLTLLCARLIYWVVIPTLIAAYYFFEMATPLYATKSEFIIQQAEAQNGGGFGTLFQGTGLAVQQDSTTVQSYLQSREAMARLDADLGFRDHWSADSLDALRRLPNDATNEDLYRRYKKSVRIGFDPTEGILKMEVIASDPETARAWAERLISYAEGQVDGLTERLRSDQMRGAEESYNDAERQMQQAQARVLSLQEQRGVLDPVAETTGQLQQILQFETQLREKQLELAQLESNRRPNEAKVAGVQGDISRLESLVVSLRSALTEQRDGAASLAKVAGEIRVAEADLATRQLLLQQAAAQLETARIEANRQTRYLAIGVSPVAMDAPSYPKRFQYTVVTFCALLGLYLMISLTASVLREQVTS